MPRVFTAFATLLSLALLLGSASPLVRHACAMDAPAGDATARHACCDRPAEPTAPCPDHAAPAPQMDGTCCVLSAASATAPTAEAAPTPAPAAAPAQMLAASPRPLTAPPTQVTVAPPRSATVPILHAALRN